MFKLQSLRQFRKAICVNFVTDHEWNKTRLASRKRLTPNFILSSGWEGVRLKTTCLKNDRDSSEKQNHKLKDTCKLVTSPATLIHFLLLF